MVRSVQKSTKNGLQHTDFLNCFPSYWCRLVKKLLCGNLFCCHGLASPRPPPYAVFEHLKAKFPVFRWLKWDEETMKSNPISQSGVDAIKQIQKNYLSHPLKQVIDFTQYTLKIVHAQCAYIDLWVHAGSLESTKEA